MKTKIFATLLFSIAAFTSCRDMIYEKSYRNIPVYMEYEELRSAVKYEGPTELIAPGKIYFKDGFIFINEEMQGVHIIDNRDPSNPVNTGFISIPGNMDMAIKGNILYADSYVDLVAIDISGFKDAKEVSRVRDVFPYYIPPLADDKYPIGEIDKDKGVVTGWKVRMDNRKIDTHYFPVYPSGWFGSKYDYVVMNESSPGAAGSAGFGIGGSLARFGLNGDFLYAIDNSQFHIFDTKDAGKPELVNEPFINNQAETVFVHDNNLFIGTRSGMLVYSIAKPGFPEFKASFRHIYSCDPVVVQYHVAYVTLRSGNGCGQTVNRLDVYKLNDNYDQSTEMYSYFMIEPYGLGIDDEILFVCDGSKGLRVFDASDISVIGDRELVSFPDIQAFDVIPFNDHLFMIGDDGFYQYDYSDINNIYLISKIPVTKD